MVILLCGLILALPWLKADKIGIATMLLLVFAAIFAGRASWRWPGKAMILLFAAALFLFPFGVIARGFGRVDMIALIFHAQAGIDGAGPGLL